MDVLTSIIPVFITIMAGFFIKKHFIKSDDFWAETDRLVFYILIPVMLIHVLINAPFNQEMLVYGAIIFGVITFIFLITLLLRPFMNTDGPGFTSVVQGSVRVNFFISLSIASLAYGSEGVTILSFALLFTVLSGVMFSVFCLQRYGHKNPNSPQQNTFIRMIKNPVILSTLVGFGVGLFIDELPVTIDKTFTIFDRAALPLALLAIGSSLKPSSLGKQIKPVVISTILGLIISPLCGVLLCHYYQLPTLLTICCILMLGVPAAASSITFAARMGGDKELMSSILTTQTILGIVTIPIFIYMAHYLETNPIF